MDSHAGDAAPPDMTASRAEAPTASVHDLGVWRISGAHGWQRLTQRGARKWYFGSSWGLAFLAIPVILSWTTHDDPVRSTITTAWLVVLGLAYSAIPPLLWGRRVLTVVLVFAAFAAYTLFGIPLIGVDFIWLWIYIPIMAAMMFVPRPFTITTIVLVLGAQIGVVAATGDFEEEWSVIAITGSISVMMFAFGQQIQAIIRLRTAQSEIARLAVVDERARFARDMHDVLGHSLTVVTVKAELAGRLVTADPKKAVTEIADVERLSRAALTDLRQAVAGYREMSVATELAAAQAALTAADITPHLPTSVDSVAPELRELFGWVLRESVTNVIRHSGARNCWVAIEPRAIRIGDDGRGGVQWSPEARGSHGMGGLAERARQVGADFTVTPGEEGGTVVRLEA